MLRARLVTAAVAIPLLLALVLAAPAWLFAVVVSAIACVGVLEYMTMAFRQRTRDRVTGVALGGLVILSAAGGPGPAVFGALACTLAVGLVSTFWARADFTTGFKDFGVLLIGVLYVGFLLPHFIWLREASPHGPELVIFLLATVMTGDSGGYFVGRSFGHRKLLPHVSPGKTVEGAVGIVMFSIIGGLAARSLVIPTVNRVAGSSFAMPLNWAEILTLAAVTGVVGQLGDLSESVMKRTYAVKESGWVFPGHGGVLDRIDSLLFPLVVVYYYVVGSR